jgi:hypothetical protein
MNTFSLKKFDKLVKFEEEMPGMVAFTVWMNLMMSP